MGSPSPLVVSNLGKNMTMTGMTRDGALMTTAMGEVISPELCTWKTGFLQLSL